MADLTVTFKSGPEFLNAVDGISFSLCQGRTLALVGESGCGKTTTAMAIMGLLPRTGGISAASRIVFADVDLRNLPDKQIRKLRGNDIAYIPQEPVSALNPIYTIGRQLAEVQQLHGGPRRGQVRESLIDALRDVGVTRPEDRLKSYPHELSGGIAQRVLIAAALLRKPRLLIADEPTTALDVTVQAQILRLLGTVQERHQTAILLITHDFGVVAELAHDVAVMYAGRVVEIGDVDEIFRNPRHPYTEALLRSVPKVGVRQKRLPVIPGGLPVRPLRGCCFADKCPRAEEDCRSTGPELRRHAGQAVACLHPLGASADNSRSGRNHEQS